MFKFVVVLAFVATVVADPEPGVLLSAPYVQPYAAYSTLVSPASTSFSSQSSSVVHPTPLTYSSPLAFTHFIKKRSADPQFLATSYNAAYNYLPSAYHYSPAAVVSTPTVYSAQIGQVPIATHLIKKRSPQLLSTSYITPTTYIGNPALTTPLISTPYIQNPYFGTHVPLVNTHLIKKRSAEPTPEPSAEPQTFFPSTYLTPSTYINSLATPYVASPLLNNYYPTAAAFPFSTAHLIKKRSAKAEPEPAADPQLAINTFPTTYYSGYSPLNPAFPSATLIKSAPIFSGNPFVYSTYIKK